jgi:TPR repeat protein
MTGLPVHMACAVRRPALAIMCAVTLMLGTAGATRADEPADKEMADTYLQAARAGDANAQFYLGALHATGIGRMQSDTEAVAWLTRAAEQGHAQAALVVAGHQAIGRGTPLDLVRAYRWAAVAAANARSDEIKRGAQQVMRLLETRLTDDELRRAKASDPLRAGPANAGAAPNVADAETAAQEKPAGYLDGLLTHLPQGLRKRIGL